MYYSSKYHLQPGDRIVEPIFQTGLSKHHSIYLGVDQNGVELVSENQKFVGVRLVKASDYFKPDRKYKIERLNGDYYQRQAAVKRALEKLGQPYDLIVYNCEHYAEYVQTGKAESMQVTNVVNGLLAAAVVVFVVGIINSFKNN